MFDEPTEEAGPQSQPGSLPLCLLVYGPDRVQVVRLAEGKEIVVGRAPPANLVIKSPSLSRQHAKILKQGGEVWVEDLGSKNGTRVNGRRVDRKRLLADDQIGVGNVVICLHAPTGEDVDPNPSLFSHDHFRTIVELEIDRARTYHRRLALILAREENAGADGGLRAWYPRVRKLLRSVDRLAQYGPHALEVVLTEAGREEAERVVERIVGEQGPGQPAILCGVALFPDSGSTADELLEASRYASQRATPEHPVHFAPSIADAREPLAAAPIVQSEAMQKLYEQVDRLSRAAIPVLVLGETGVGKEVVAQALHQRGPRAEAPMRCINCAAIPSELIESVLFGHVRGAFTGAENEQVGVFEAADGGTLLLDEVGELSAAAQAALLRVLETKTLTRIGSNEERKVDVRVVAATHRDLEAMVAEGKFRSDLLYRLNAITLEIPPLRERLEEIRPLVEAFGDEAASANGASPPRFTPAAFDAFGRYHWPGNIRELRNVIEYAVVIADEATIDVADLPDRFRDDGETDEHGGVPARTAPTGDEPDFKKRIRIVEEAWIREALDAVGNQKTEAAERLRIPVRTLSHKLSSFEETPMPKLADERERQVVLEELDRRAPERDVEFKVRIQRFEASLIAEALAASGGNKAQASRALGIPLRTLVNKVRTYEL